MRIVIAVHGDGTVQMVFSSGLTTGGVKDQRPQRVPQLGQVGVEVDAELLLAKTPWFPARRSVCSSWSGSRD